MDPLDRKPAMGLPRLHGMAHWLMRTDTWRLSNNKSVYCINSFSMPFLALTFGAKVAWFFGFMLGLADPMGGGKAAAWKGPGFLYATFSLELNEWARDHRLIQPYLFKVGFSTNVDKRLRHLSKPPYQRRDSRWDYSSHSLN
jgi:hypothetical protein